MKESDAFKLQGVEHLLLLSQISFGLLQFAQILMYAMLNETLPICQMVHPSLNEAVLITKYE